MGIEKDASPTPNNSNAGIGDPFSVISGATIPLAARAWQLPLLAILLVVLTMTTIGLAVYLSARQYITNQANENLAAISQLKVRQIEHWLGERRDDALFVTRSSMFSRNLQQWIAGGRQDKALQENLLRHLRDVSAIPHYLVINLHSASDGLLLLSSSDHPTEFAHDSLLARQAAQQQTSLFDDLHVASDEKTASIELGYFIPISHGDGPPLAVIHLITDPGKLLFPLLQQLPSTSPSAETLLIRRDGEQLVYLNTLRHRSNSALNFRMPRNTPGLLAAMAAEGKTGAIRGIDYRNIPSLGHALPVAGTPWLMIAKIDEAEIYAHLNRLALFSAVVTALALLAGIAWVVIHRRSTGRIERLSRLYAAISQTNQAIIRSQTPAEVYRAVCNACVELAGLRLAWVSMADQQTQQLRPLESAGVAAAYLENILISTRPDLPEGQGPAGTAFREGRPCESSDFLGDPGTTPWQARAAEYGLGSLIALPLRRAGRVVGTLCVYGGEKNFFDAEAHHILGEMANNISFFLDHFDREAERQRLEIEQAAHENHLRVLSRRLVAVQEEERRQLVSELHDSTSPNLAAIQVILNTMKPHLEALTAPSELHDWLQDALALLEDTGQNVREICGELRPSLLDYAGLVAALNGYARQFSRRTGIAVDFRGDENAPRLSSEIESTLFRIAQEALTNCAKHAEASHIALELMRSANDVALIISDNGSGFAPENLGAPGGQPGLGLITMRERAEFIGGTFTLASQPGRGTTITVRLGVPSTPSGTITAACPAVASHGE